MMTHFEPPASPTTVGAPPAPVSAVILDMDGTLLDLHFDDQVWFHRLPALLAAREGCTPEAARRAVATRIAGVRGSLEWYCLDHWSRVFGVSIHAVETELGHLVRLRPGTAEFLAHLAARGIRAILATNAHPASLERKLARTGLARWFDAIRSSHPYGYPKERAEFWHALHADLGFDPAHAIFVDDNPAVLDAARAWGIGELYGVHSPSSTGPRREFTAYPAVDSLAELVSRCARPLPEGS
jgi:putative hydrolase of the HAD superfamily